MKFNKVILILFLIFISLGAVSAADDGNDTFAASDSIDSDYISVSEDINSDSISVSEYENISLNDESVIEDKNPILTSENEDEIIDYSLKSKNTLEDTNNDPNKKTPHFSIVGVLDMDYPGFYNFYYGKPLKIGVLLFGSGNDILTGNMTAVCNGNVYQGVFGDYVDIPTNPTWGSRKYNYYFEITNYTLGENPIEFIYSGDSNYNSYSQTVTFTSVKGLYDDSNNSESKKTVYFKRIRNFEMEWKWPTTGDIPFFYGKPLIIAVDLGTRGSSDIFIGNVTAVCNGNVYQGVFGNYTTYSHDANNPNITYVNYVYHYIFEISNYTLGDNVIEFFYSGDDEHNGCSLLVTFEPEIDDYLDTSHMMRSGNTYFAREALYKTFNLYDARGNLTVICNDVVTTYNLTGDVIRHEFSKYYMGINNYTLIYSGDDTYNGFVSEKSAYTHLAISYKSMNVYIGETVEMTVWLDNAVGNVTVTVNNNSYDVDLVDGIAHLEIKNYTNGYNPVEVAYSGDDNYPSFVYLDDNIRGFTVLGKRNLSISSALVQNDNTNCLIIQLFNENGLIGNGSLNIQIDGQDVFVDFVNGVAVYNLTVDTVDDILVTYGGNSMYNPVSSSYFMTLGDDYIVNKDNWIFYFNQANGGKFFDWIQEGVTLDFRGSIIAPGAYFNVNKPVNIISSRKNAFVDFNTTAGSLLGENPGARFAISNGGSFSNVTGIYFHNTQVWLENVTHVVLDNISVVVEDQRVGSGVGATSIRSNSSYVTVKNSYFYTRNNGGSSTLVGAWANYCTFDNNTLVVEGTVGNMIYFTTFNVEIPEGALINSFNNITNNRLKGPAQESNICWGIVMSGASNILENNTVDIYGAGITGQWGGVSYDDLYSPMDGKVTGNVLLRGSSLYGSGLVYNNYVSGDLSVSDCIAYNNTVGKNALVHNGTLFNNTIGGFLEIAFGASHGAGSVELYDNQINDGLYIESRGSIHDNVINGEIRFTKNLNDVQLCNNLINGSFIMTRDYSDDIETNISNVSILNNTIYGSINSLKSSSSSIINNTIVSDDLYAVDLTGSRENLVCDNYIHADSLYGNDAVKNSDESNIVKDNGPLNPNLTVSTNDIFVGDVLDINVRVNSSATGTVNVIIDGKVYELELTKGRGKLSLDNLSAGEYYITVIFNGDNVFASDKNETVVKVSKYSPVLEMAFGNATIGEDLTISFTVFGATGDIKVFADGLESTITLNNSVSSYTIYDLSAGSHSIVALYEGDNRNNPATASQTFTLEKSSPVIDINLGDFKLNENCDVCVFIENATGVVNVIVDGIETNITLIDGFANHTIENVTPGVHSVVVIYNGDDKFNPAHESVSKELKMISTHIVDISVDELIIRAVLVDDEGNGLNKTAVRYTINNVTNSTVTDENGAFTITGEEDSKVNIVYLGDGIFLPTDTVICLNKLPPKMIDSVLNVSNLNCYAVDYSAGERGALLKIRLTDSNGNAISNETVKIALENNVYSIKTDSNGFASMNVNIKDAGTYTAVVFFPGNDRTKSAFETAKITVNKKTTSIVAKAKTFNAKAKSKKYTATLKTIKGSSANGKIYLKSGKKVTLTVNKKTYTAKINSKGQVSFNLKLTKKGSYSAVIKFSGDGTYKACSKKVKITIK